MTTPEAIAAVVERLRRPTTMHDSVAMFSAVNLIEELVRERDATDELLSAAVEDCNDMKARAERAEAALADARNGALREAAELVAGFGPVIPMWDRPGGPPGNGPMRPANQRELAAAIRSLITQPTGGEDGE